MASRKKWPWRTMEIGEFFMYPSFNGPQRVYQWNTELSPKRFISKREGDFYRIERVA